MYKVTQEQNSREVQIVLILWSYLIYTRFSENVKFIVL